MIYQSEIELTTNGHRDLQDITKLAEHELAASGLKSGVLHLFNIGSTASLGTIEFEPGLKRDLPELLDRLIPPSPQYGHEQAWHDGNGHSHLQATWLGPSLSVSFADGKLVLGTWQQIFHLECDIKPRHRRIVVTAIGER